jgi:LytS/YehU family sensor histidine kinase
MFVQWFFGPLKASVVITLVFGVFATVIELLQRRLDNATVALRTKERDESDARRLAAEAQLASIESRVQPHFLFNTLNSIAALVHDDPAGAERMTGQRASLLRSALDSTATPLVSLDQELRIVRVLDIGACASAIACTMTYSGRHRVGHRAAHGATTLVENASNAVSSRASGSISVTITANGHVRIVEDDGPGFNAIPPGEWPGTARCWLAMLFGDRASMSVVRHPGETRVTLDVPS